VFLIIASPGIITPWCEQGLWKPVTELFRQTEENILMKKWTQKDPVKERKANQIQSLQHALQFVQVIYG